MSTKTPTVVPPAPLQDELARAAHMAAGAAGAEIVIALMGWSGAPSCSLDEVAQRFGHGRDRVRDVRARALRWLIEKGEELPTLTRVAAAIHAAGACLESDMVAVLAQAGLVRAPFDLAAVAATLVALRRPPGFELRVIAGERYVGRAAELTALSRLRQRALRSIARSGAASRTELVAMFAGRLAPQTIDRFFDGRSEFERVEDGDWIVARDAGGTDRIGTRLKKMLAVAESVSLAELREALRRGARARGMVPSETAIRAAVAGMPECRLSGATIARLVRFAPDLVLSPMERVLYRALAAHSGATPLAALEATCLEAGMNRNTFRLYLSWSPIVRRVAPALYALVGRPVAASDMRPIVHRRDGVVLRAERLGDGRARAAWRLTASTLTNGVVSFPAALGELAYGTYECRDRDGAVLGRCRVRPAGVSGLRRILNTSGAIPGMVLVLEFGPASIARLMLERAEERAA